MKTTLDQIRHLPNEKLLKILLSSMQKKYHASEIEFVQKTYRLTLEILFGQIALQEKEIENYVRRSLFSAILLAELNIRLNLDVRVIVAALLSDLIEHRSIASSLTKSGKKSVSAFDAKEVSTLLNILEVNKYELPLPWRVRYSEEEKHEQHNTDRAHRAILRLIQSEGSQDRAWLDNFKKFIQVYISACKSLDVLIFKLVDRLPTIYLLEELISVKEQRDLIATETLRIHAFLAEASGFWIAKWALEDQSFRYLDPLNYNSIAKRLADSRIEREEYIKRVIRVLERRFEEKDFKATIEGRPKHIYSIYKKMKKFGTDFQEVFDVLGIRVIVQTENDCWRALAIITEDDFWPAIPNIYGDQELIRDWIARKKENEYRSIHVTVRSLEDRRLEVQIRTFEMDEVAKYGSAAHWRYKLTEKRTEPTERTEKELIDKMGKWQQTVSNYLRTL